MEIDGTAAGTPPMAPQSALPPVTGGAVGSTPPVPPPLASPESGATQGGAASVPPSQAATPMVVDSGRPEDLDWWVPPTHPTAMGEGGHLLSIYLTFPDSEQVTAWNRHSRASPVKWLYLPGGWWISPPYSNGRIGVKSTAYAGASPRVREQTRWRRTSQWLSGVVVARSRPT